MQMATGMKPQQPGEAQQKELETLGKSNLPVVEQTTEIQGKEAKADAQPPEVSSSNEAATTNVSTLPHNGGSQQSELATVSSSEALSRHNYQMKMLQK